MNLSPSVAESSIWKCKLEDGTTKYKIPSTRFSLPDTCRKSGEPLNYLWLSDQNF